MYGAHHMVIMGGTLLSLTSKLKRPDIADDIAVVSAFVVHTPASPCVHELTSSVPAVAVIVNCKAVLFPWLSCFSAVNT